MKSGSDSPDPKLFDLAEDIGEANDQSVRQPEKVKQLQDAWNTWNAQQKPPLWGGDTDKPTDPKRGT